MVRFEAVLTHVLAPHLRFVGCVCYLGFLTQGKHHDINTALYFYFRRFSR
jgi:hypothetical protein